MALVSIDPTTGAELARRPEHTPAELEARLANAAATFPAWRRTPVAERSARLTSIAAGLRARRRELAELAVREMGKPIAAAEAEVDKCAATFDWYAGEAARLLAPLPVAVAGSECRVRYDPLGAILAVMPWNFPYWQAVRFAAPALAAGNVGLLKPASNVTGCALALEETFAAAGVPAGVFQLLLVRGERAASLADDPRIAAVTLTGSEAAGAAVGAVAGAALKKVVLELGGADPFLVLPSADLAGAARAAVAARTVNNGQSCIAAKRFYVHTSAWDGFVPAFVRGLAALRVGDPMDPATELGPLAGAALRDELARQVRESLGGGAILLTGGHALPGPGFFFAPTAIAEPPADSPAAREELFGPVAAIFRVADLDEAIARANDSPFGLGAAVWTGERSEAERAAAELEVGTVRVNGIVASDPRLPFGGVKRSGHGRELGEWGLREFVNVKSVQLGGELR